MIAHRPVNRCPYKALFFDNDGILVDTEALFFQANKTVMAHYGVEFTREQFIEVSLKQGKHCFSLINDPKFDKSAYKALQESRNQIYEKLLKTSSSVIPGVDFVLKKLSEVYPLSVVTTSLRKNFEIIHAQTGFFKYFDFVIAREDVVRCKPDPEPYLLACEKAGVKPSEALVVEDSERGVLAAYQAGIDVVGIPTDLTRNQNFSKATKTLRNVTDLLDFLAIA